MIVNLIERTTRKRVDERIESDLMTVIEYTEARERERERGIGRGRGKGGLLLSLPV